MAWRLPKMPTLSAEWRQRLQEAERVTRRANNTLDILWRARGGNPLEMGLAGIAAAGEAIRLFLPHESAHNFLTDSGYGLFNSELDQFICLLFEQDGTVRKTTFLHHEGEDIKIVYWNFEGEDPFSASIYRKNAVYLGPYFSVNRKEAFSSALKQVAWAVCNELVIEVGAAEESTVQSEDDLPRRPNERKKQTVTYKLFPDDAPAKYIGQPPLDWYAERMSHYRGMKENRTIQLLGPSGVGKSTLGKALGKAMFGEQAKTLRLSSATAASLSRLAIIQLAECLQPDVFLIDDLETSSYSFDATILAFLESLHKKIPLTVLTWMVEKQVSGQRYSGMRPGRIDERFPLAEPDIEVRKQLLLHFFGPVHISLMVLAYLAEKTAGMTGAYIAELVKRIKLHGLENYKAETAKMILECAEPASLPMSSQLTPKKLIPTFRVKNGIKCVNTKITRDRMENLAAMLGVDIESAKTKAEIAFRINEHWTKKKK